MPPPTENGTNIAVRLLHRFQQSPASFVRRRNVEQDNLIAPAAACRAANSAGIACVDQIHKLNAPSPRAAGYVQTSNDALGQHANSESSSGS